MDDVGFGRIVEGEVLAIVANLRGRAIGGCCDRAPAFAAADDLGGEVVDGHCCLPGLPFLTLCRLRHIRAHSASLRDFRTPPPDRWLAGLSYLRFPGS